jgi:hypothetical protein
MKTLFTIYVTVKVGRAFPVMEDGQEPIYLHDFLLALNFKTERVLEAINQVFFLASFGF